MEQSPSWEADSHSANQELTAFSGVRMFVIVFTRSHHWSLSWARWIQYKPSHSISIRSIQILSPRLRLDLVSDVLPLGFPTKSLYALLISPMRVSWSPSFHPSWLVYPNNIWWSIQAMKCSHLIISFIIIQDVFVLEDHSEAVFQVSYIFHPLNMV
jgi:hypothetical protein